jgi:hypothetical protein
MKGMGQQYETDRRHEAAEDVYLKLRSGRNPLGLLQAATPAGRRSGVTRIN